MKCKILQCGQLCAVLQPLQCRWRACKFLPAAVIYWKSLQVVQKQRRGRCWFQEEWGKGAWKALSLSWVKDARCRESINKENRAYCWRKISLNKDVVFVRAGGQAILNGMNVAGRVLHTAYRSKAWGVKIREGAQPLGSPLCLNPAPNAKW